MVCHGPIIQIKRSQTLNYFKFLFLYVFLLPVCGYAQILTKGPFLVEPGDTIIRIRWETDKPLDCSVKFGQKEVSDNEVRAELRGEKHGGYLYQIR